MNQFKNSLLISFLTVSMVLSVMYTQGQEAMLNKSSFNAVHTTFSAGADATICKGNDYVTQGFSHSPVLTLWQSSGDGVFENSNQLITVYNPGEQDMINGSVILSLVLLPMGGSGSEVIVDDMILNLGNCRAIHQLD